MISEQIENTVNSKHSRLLISILTWRTLFRNANSVRKFLWYSENNLDTLKVDVSILSISGYSSISYFNIELFTKNR